MSGSPVMNDPEPTPALAPARDLSQAGARSSRYRARISFIRSSFSADRSRAK